jgi:hypothetical protein
MIKTSPQYQFAPLMIGYWRGRFMSLSRLYTLAIGICPRATIHEPDDKTVRGPWHRPPMLPQVVFCDWCRCAHKTVPPHINPPPCRTECEAGLPSWRPLPPDSSAPLWSSGGCHHPFSPPRTAPFDRRQAQGGGDGVRDWAHMYLESRSSLVAAGDGGALSCASGNWQALVHAEGAGAAVELASAVVCVL